MEDIKYMRRCFELAQKGMGNVAPNPMVGAVIVHNGEINTIKGNADKMLAREETLETNMLSSDDFTKVLPVVNNSGSDSAMLDNTLEFLVMSGLDLPLAASLAASRIL